LKDIDFDRIDKWLSDCREHVVHFPDNDSTMVHLFRYVEWLRSELNIAQEQNLELRVHLDDMTDRLGEANDQVLRMRRCG